MEKTKVAIIGLGTVGSGVARILLDHGDRTARHAGRTLWLEKAVVRDLNKARDCDLPAGVLTDDIEEVINDPEITLVAQLIGGLEPARTVMLRLLEAGKDVVTANKALLAEHGPELFDRARELGRSIAFEASVAGGIPIIANISQCLSANQITSLHGILNGTSNYILCKMHEEGGGDYAAAVADAQRLGYAEADPTMDVDGSDAAQKLAILSHLAFGARLNWRDIPRVGIDKVDPIDIGYAKQMGYNVRLLAIADLKDHGLDCEVTPALVRADSPLGQVNGPFNAVLVKGDAVGPLFFHGQGAGQMPTASAVAADLIDSAVGRTGITFRTLELWSDAVKGVERSDFATSTGRRYVRLMVDDHPGVLANVTQAFGDQSISIASVLQKEPLAGDAVVPLVIMTHAASEAAIDKACATIAKLPACRSEPVKMWVRD
ncbi:MAG: homoserine dehydrogenase [Planctomycetaceae bacterium]|nr:homoserine dehydrogenase [Planctomycetaceae bacterium]